MTEQIERAIRRFDAIKARWQDAIAREENPHYWGEMADAYRMLEGYTIPHAGDVGLLGAAACRSRQQHAQAWVW